MWKAIWLFSVIFGSHDNLEPTDRLIPAGWKGNPWGPEAVRAREAGVIPPIVMTEGMKQWDAWGRKVLRDGDILFRRGDARLLFGHFPFSKFLANVTGSVFSHTGIVAIEGGAPYVYDTTKAGARRQPFHVWVLDNAGPFGVKRPKPEYLPYATKAVTYCRDLFQKQPPFDYDLSPDDRAFYCVEMCDKAYRTSGLPLAEPLRLSAMENIQSYPVCVYVFLQISNLNLDQLVFFPGNESHGLWSSPYLTTVYGPKDGARAKIPTNLQVLARFFAATRPRSEAGAERTSE